MVRLFLVILIMGMVGNFGSFNLLRIIRIRFISRMAMENILMYTRRIIRKEHLLFSGNLMEERIRFGDLCLFDFVLVEELFINTLF
jgi:hypothetical protein